MTDKDKNTKGNRFMMDQDNFVDETDSTVQENRENNTNIFAGNEWSKDNSIDELSKKHKHVVKLLESIEKSINSVKIANMEPSSMAEVEKTTKDTILELEDISKILTSKGSDLFFEKRIEQMQNLMGESYSHFEGFSISELSYNLNLISDTISSVELAKNSSTKANMLPSDKSFLQIILYSIAGSLLLLNSSLLSIKTIKEGGETEKSRENYLKKVDGKIGDIESNGQLFSRFLELPNLISELHFDLEEKDALMLKPIRDQIIEGLNVAKHILSKIDIEHGGYKPKLSDVNSHIPTSKLFPNHTSGNYGMWPDKIEKYQYLIVHDRENWIGKNWHTESISGEGSYFAILYRDFLDFIQSLGYTHLKVTHYDEEKRKQPSLKSFTWKEEIRKFRPFVSIYFYNEKCPVIGKESRIIIQSYMDSHGDGEIVCKAGVDLMETEGEFNDKPDDFIGGVEHESILRLRAEEMVREIFKQFEEYQKTSGLLKNAKFDAKFRELNSKGRTFNQMVMEDIKLELLDDNIFTIIENHQSLHEIGVQTNRGIILAGPPGVGKSMTIDSIISQANCTVIYADFMSLHRNMEGIFAVARKYSPTILILEDIDALGITGQRDSFNTGGGMSTLLNCMDGIESNDGVITVATSNHPEHLDWALVNRPGRFDIRIDYHYPNTKALEEILSLKLSPYLCADNLDLNKIAKEMPHGFTGSHIQDIVNQANYISIKNKSSKLITQKSLQSAFERTLYNFNKFLQERKMKSTDLPSYDKSKPRQDDTSLWG